MKTKGFFRMNFQTLVTEVVAVLLTTVSAFSQRFVGELRITVKNSSALTISLAAQGNVGGSRCDWYPWTHDYDNRSQTNTAYAWKHLDREVGDCENEAGTDSTYIAYGNYQITIEGKHLEADFRDGDYEDGNGCGTGYSTADLYIYYNHLDSLFYKDESLTQRIYDYIAIWQDSRKSSGPVVPVTVGNGLTGGAVVVDGNSYTTSYTAKWAQDGSHTLNVSSPQTISGLIYSYSSWSDGGSQSHNVTASLANFGKVWTANMSVVKPVQVSGVGFSSGEGGVIQIDWDENACTDVVYKIYRIIGKFGTPEYLATVNHGTTTYSDEQYTLGGSQLLYYDVRAYHTPSQTYADVHWNPTYGTINMQKGGGDKKPVLKSQTVKEYSVGCYPNPFNPSTTISFALVENADVKLDIYDMTGRKIASLFDGESSAGIHSVVWNGRDQAGVSVSSGLYFYRFRSVPLNGQKPFIKTGKLILMK